MGQQEDGVQRPSLSSYTLWQEALKSLCFRVCSGEGKAEPAPLLTGTMSKEPNKLWLWDSPLLVPISTFCCWSVPGSKLIFHVGPLCFVKGEVKLLTVLILILILTCIQPFLSFGSAHVVSTVIQA